MVPEPPPSGAHPSSPADLTPWAIALTGMLALGTAMGIGRFAFTPLLPMMLHDGVLDLSAASWLASANYLGYLLGALLCTFQSWIWSRFTARPPLAATHWIRMGLVGTCLLTLGMALHMPALWPLLRFLAGVASAMVFIFSSGWCLFELAKRDASRLGGVMYAGPGAGVLLSGLLASGMVALHFRAAAGWLTLGFLACVLTALAWRRFDKSASLPVAAPVAMHPVLHGAVLVSHRQMLLLAVAYGLAGFGYIVTATFLPVIARQALPGSPWLDMFWPLFGLGVMAGSLLATRISLRGDLRYLLAGCYGLQALGVAVTVWSPTLAGFVAGSLLLGLPFTAITFFAMQEVRRLKPESMTSYMGLLTALYGVGQIAGPPMVAVLLRHTSSLAEGFALSLAIATSSLLLGAALYLWMVRAYPLSAIRPSRMLPPTH